MQPPSVPASSAASAVKKIVFVMSAPSDSKRSRSVQTRSARDRTILDVAPGAQRSDELCHVLQSLGAQIPDDPFIDPAAHQRVVEERRADPDRARAGDQKLDR